MRCPFCDNFLLSSRYCPDCDYIESEEIYQTYFDDYEIYLDDEVSSFRVPFLGDDSFEEE